MPTGVVTAQFNPFTFDELYKPIAIATSTQMALEDQYNAMAMEAAKWEKLAGSNVDSDSYQKYKSYANALKEASNELMTNGLNPQSRQALYGLRTRFNEEIYPLQEAYNWRQKQAEAQQKAIYEDNTYVPERNAYDIPLSEIIANPSMVLRGVSGEKIENDIAQTVQNMTKLWGSPEELIELKKRFPGHDEDFDGFFENKKQYGLSYKQLDEFLKKFNDGDADKLRGHINNLLNQAVLATYNKYDIGSYNSPAIDQRFNAAVNQGLFRALGHDESSFLNTNRGTGNGKGTGSETPYDFSTPFIKQESISSSTDNGDIITSLASKKVLDETPQTGSYWGGNAGHMGKEYNHSKKEIDTRLGISDLTEDEKKFLGDIYGKQDKVIRKAGNEFNRVFFGNEENTNLMNMSVSMYGKPFSKLNNVEQSEVVKKYNEQNPNKSKAYTDYEIENAAKIFGTVSPEFKEISEKYGNDFHPVYEKEIHVTLPVKILYELEKAGVEKGSKEEAEIIEKYLGGEGNENGKYTIWAATEDPYKQPSEFDVNNLGVYNEKEGRTHQLNINSSRIDDYLERVKKGGDAASFYHYVFDVTQDQAKHWLNLTYEANGGQPLSTVQYKWDKDKHDFVVTNDGGTFTVDDMNPGEGKTINITPVYSNRGTLLRIRKADGSIAYVKAKMYGTSESDINNAIEQANDMSKTILGLYTEMNNTESYAEQMNILNQITAYQNARKVIYTNIQKLLGNVLGVSNVEPTKY